MTGCDCQDVIVFGCHCPPSPAADPGLVIRVLPCPPPCRAQHQPPPERPYRYPYAGRRRSIYHLGGYVPPLPGGTP